MASRLWRRKRQSEAALTRHSWVPAVGGGSKRRIAIASQVLPLLTFVGLAVNVYFTHFHHDEHLEIGIVQYRLAAASDGVRPLSLYIDIALINRGDTAARYIGSTLYASFLPKTAGAYPIRSASDKRLLIEPRTIQGLELIFPPIDIDRMRQDNATAQKSDDPTRVGLLLETTVMDSHGRLLVGSFDLDEIRYWKGGVLWYRAKESGLIQRITPDRKSRPMRGSGAFWKPFGMSFNEDGSVRNVGFYPDSTAADSSR